MKTVLVVGETGQLARELARAAWAPGVELTFAGRDIIDLARPETATAVVAAMKPGVVVNAAAYTAVDKAESDADQAFLVNRDGPAALARAAATVGAPLIHVSTDYVFDGTKDGAYTEDDPVAPVSVYGRSKEAGERAVREAAERHVILRTAWVYSPFGSNFVKTMLRLGAEREELRVVADQRGCPTAAADIAAAIVRLAGADHGWGTYHYSGAGPTTWHGFAEAIFAGAVARGAKVPARVTAIGTADYPTPAVRPANSVLDCSRIDRVHGIVARNWREALEDCLDALIGPRT
ncbi:MAG: dTDP-4-dehydrorhamnose reductase [Alphaproteobacteria bacterium]|nr:dTDP-4-dehydrorhamnose reductase [Alphaproteobacteria bacterium]